MFTMNEVFNACTAALEEEAAILAQLKYEHEARQRELAEKAKAEAYQAFCNGLAAKDAADRRSLANREACNGFPFGMEAEPTNNPMMGLGGRWRGLVQGKRIPLRLLPLQLRLDRDPAAIKCYLEEK